jgi:hypothetical protein
MTSFCPNPACPDIELFGVRGEYSGGVTHCPKCGVELETRTPEPEAHTQPTVELAEPEWLDLEMPETGEFSYVTNFRDLPSAHVAKSLLNAHGIYAELLDENTVSMNWALSQAIGGVKLVIATADPDEVSRLLDTLDSHDLDEIPEMAQPPSPYEVCPRCGSTDVVWPRWSQSIKAVTFFNLWFLLWVWLILFYPVVKHFEPTRCASCRKLWFPQWAG